MTIAVTDAMIDAAQPSLGLWNRARIRRALEAALALVPDEHTVDIPTAINVHFLVDEQQMRAAVLQALDNGRSLLPVNPGGTLDVAELRALVHQRPTVAVTEPVLNPVLERPIELGNLTHIAARLGVARTTVSGWVKNREHNGMPGPVDGLSYDLDAIDTWYRGWKQTPADGS